MDLFDRLMTAQIENVDWIPFFGPLREEQGLYATHMGFVSLGPFELKVYKLNTGESVFDADSVGAAVLNGLHAS